MTPSTLQQLQGELRKLSTPEKAAFLPRYFKTGKGQYGEGDRFLGVTVPQMRSVAKKYREFSLPEIETLLADPTHEYRLTGLMILVSQFEKGDDKLRKKLVDFYLSHLKGVNNWDLVDTSAPSILGSFLIGKSTTLLTRLARSKSLWEQRIAIVATYAFIKENQLEETIRISEMLLHHPHDLIHKAVGWMLREAGKRNENILKKFLDKHAATMPRTMLRYSLEKFDDATKKKYMRKKSERKAIE